MTSGENLNRNAARTAWLKRGAGTAIALAMGVILGLSPVDAPTALAQQNDLGIITPPAPSPVDSTPLEPVDAPPQDRRAEAAAAARAGGNDFISTAQAQAKPLLGQYGAPMALLAVAAAFGGFLGARISRGRSRRVDAAAPAVRGKGAKAVKGGRAPVDGPLEPGFDDDEPPVSSGGGAGGAKGGEESERLLAFFRERFNIETETADGAIDYLNRLGGSVEKMRHKLDAAEQELAQIKADGGSPLSRDSSSRDAAKAAPWELISEGGRIMRSAGASLRADPDFVALSAESLYEDWMRELMAQRAAHAEQGGIDPEIVEEAWPHALFRTEALTLAYYPTYDDWRDFRLGLTAVATGVRTLLRREGVFVENARLLSPLEPDEGEIWSDTSQGLRELEPVRRTVVANAGGGSDAFVIDCESFGYIDEARDLRLRSKVIVFNRAEWR
ncbi:MAG: hypothetical protein KTR21_08455 [Rhodobacteraceae bacterium]|nr:hypothetical protein [Paracoccaceae bacterium]